MSTFNGVEVLTGSEMARECGIGRAGWEWWIAHHGHQFPPDGRLTMGKKTIYWWLPESAKRILEARQP